MFFVRLGKGKGRGRLRHGEMDGHFAAGAKVERRERIDLEGGRSGRVGPPGDDAGGVSRNVGKLSGGAGEIWVARGLEMDRLRRLKNVVALAGPKPGEIGHRHQRFAAQIAAPFRHALPNRRIGRRRADCGRRAPTRREAERR